MRKSRAKLSPEFIEVTERFHAPSKALIEIDGEVIAGILVGWGAPRDTAIGASMQIADYIGLCLCRAGAERRFDA
jgi:hypothetical protein